jgi:hypothetical protein
MLTTIKTTNFRGESKVGDTVAKIFEATINTAAPENMTMNSYIVNYELYKANRTAVATDQTAFEDAVYAFQESLTAATV